MSPLVLNIMRTMQRVHRTERNSFTGEIYIPTPMKVIRNLQKVDMRPYAFSEQAWLYYDLQTQH